MRNGVAVVLHVGDHVYKTDVIQTGSGSSVGISFPDGTALNHAHELLALWKEDYNNVRPHSALGQLPPAIYAKAGAPIMQRDGTLRYLQGFAPRPVASPSHHGSKDGRIPPIAG